MKMSHHSIIKLIINSKKPQYTYIISFEMIFEHCEWCYFELNIETISLNPFP